VAGGCWIASMQWGSGDALGDLGFRFEAIDPVGGFLASIVARIGAVVVLLPLFLIDRRLVGSNAMTPQRVHDGTVGIVVLLLCGVVGAPIIEELFFRGLLMRSLRPLLGGAGSVIGQAVLFGLAHANPVY